MRWARSVAWSSTAGFHHRSTCTTWFAAVRFSPVPPALRVANSSGGPSSAWNDATRAVALPRGRPPCNTRIGAPNCSDNHGARVGELGELREHQHAVTLVDGRCRGSASNSTLPERCGPSDRPRRTKATRRPGRCRMVAPASDGSVPPAPSAGSAALTIARGGHQVVDDGPIHDACSTVRLARTTSSVLAGSRDDVGIGLGAPRMNGQVSPAGAPRPPGRGRAPRVRRTAP